MALDKNYIDITSDSIIATAVRWYSSHGNPDDRQTLAAAHPDFISFLEGSGLSLQEIEYCCLYAIGLRGTDISRYFGHAGHYNASSSIRAKLGLGPHDTNLGIFLRSKL